MLEIEDDTAFWVHNWHCWQRIMHEGDNPEYKNLVHCRKSGMLGGFIGIWNALREMNDLIQSSELSGIIGYSHGQN